MRQMIDIHHEQLAEANRIVQELSVYLFVEDEPETIHALLNAIQAAVDWGLISQDEINFLSSQN